jgi:ribosomal protein L12E/L44/L45/RPP1/RPP2
MGRLLLVALPCALLVSGCVGSIVKTVVTAPIKAAGAVVDATTTSQAEADRNRGREIRKAEEREAKERKRQEKEASEPPEGS